MKRVLNSAPRPSPLALRLVVLLLILLLVAFTSATFAATEGNPYTAIVGRNTFALKPPPPPPNPEANKPPPQPANISLQGISTILGRPQVLLKVKVPAKPPEGPKELSLVMDVGQREGEVEILEIDAAAGTVKINNAGTILPMNMKDNADKPATGAAPPATPVPQPGAPSVPQPPAVPNAGVSVTTVGGAGSGVPTRPIRSTPAATAAPQSQQADLSPEAGAIMLEVNRKLNPGLPYPPSRIKTE
jgi:hypothetical protein